MSLRRAWQVLRKELRLRPRSPIVLWALVVPIVLTLLIRGGCCRCWSCTPSPSPEGCPGLESGGGEGARHATGAARLVWPDLPQRPGYLMPAYYFLAPAYEAGVEGAPLGDVALELGIGALICVVLLPGVIAAARWMARRLVAGRAPTAAEPDDATAPVGSAPTG
ncbi:hypothetical protein ER308_04120 [Egibacter rhizosphaerae]|uniref:Uncharacterized protein n=1 Tax=Egibacter rhizosphaerae TaxID=1670831 RepID=A0A411YC34_9ACTN|nr:hypothetical protein [Egibacter rhizosphaerae]QBI18813.1 hypothetical protein ER308_04120 [Egibacter rhizosphaerae]